MFVYIITSINRNWNYVGICKDINIREQQHNKGINSSTKAYKPFELIFVQETKDYKEAREFEKYLKIRFNKESLLELIRCRGGEMVYTQDLKSCEAQTS
jgi:putative endonuclease